MTRNCDKNENSENSLVIIDKPLTAKECRKIAQKHNFWRANENNFKGKYSYTMNMLFDMLTCYSDLYFINLPMFLC